jgi:hypothetical protein
MSASKNYSGEEEPLRKIVAQAITNEDFRNELTLNPERAINDASRDLGFTYDKIPEESREVLNSFTAEELDTLHRIYMRAKEVDIPLDPMKML